MRLAKFRSTNRAARLYHRGVALSAIGVLLFLTGVLQLSGLADFGAGRLAMAVLSIAGAGSVMAGFAMMTAACCGLELSDDEPQTCVAAAEAGETIAIRVRCRSCRALNEESATLCTDCGERL